MDMFEKVEKLREKANVSYEEAKEALEKSNGDILDAMILLEKEGKTKKAGAESYSTKYEAGSELERFKNCEEKQERRERAKENCRTFGEKLKSLLKKSTENFLVIERKGERIVKLPILAMVLILIFAWYAAIIAIIVSLFMGCKYSFEGEEDFKKANDVCDKAEDIAASVKDKVVDEYNKL
ncbi:MAG: DUF4342 domain-containing protein [Lachnospiraceae bacterium]|jgi:hypothetical protein|nr:DUF4342 domain-containing protein [Lachnospiraceae bacterium]